VPTPYPVILHHFDQSPFSEKIRAIFGFKRLAWKSVRISRIMPRPDLMPLTGGYRRTPTMQIGADIYCDTQIIIRELEARFPTPTLFPGGNAGLPWALGMWSDRSFFQNTVNLVFGTLADKVPQDFIEDRERLRGAKFDVKAMKAAIPQMRDQLRAHVGWIEAQLGDGREWLLGTSASLARAGPPLCYACRRNGHIPSSRRPPCRVWQVGEGACLLLMCSSCSMGLSDCNQAQHVHDQRN
jgi:glutathione S-transferase